MFSVFMTIRKLTLQVYLNNKTVDCVCQKKKIFFVFIFVNVLSKILLFFKLKLFDIFFIFYKLGNSKSDNKRIFKMFFSAYLC